MTFDLFGALRHIDISRIYDSYASTIDFAIYLFLFIPLAQATIGRRFPGRNGKLISVAVGFLLSLGLLKMARAMDFTVRGFGPLAALFIIAAIGVVLFLALRHLKLRPLAAAAGTFIVLYFSLQAVAPGFFHWLYQRVPWISLLLLGAIIMLIVQAARQLQSVGKGPRDESTSVLEGQLEEEQQSAARLEKGLRWLRQNLAPGSRATQRQVKEVIQRLSTAEDGLALRIAKIRALTQRLEQLDIAAYAKLRKQLRGTALQQERKRLQNHLKTELKKLGVEKKLKQHEALLEQADKLTRHYLRQATEAMNEGDLAKAQAATRRALRSVERIETAARHLQKLLARLQALSKNLRAGGQR